MKEKEALQQPFFARFLENQQPEKTNNAGTNNGWVVTSKIKDDLETMKYPSDNDEDIFI
jgi:hypothetical protein